MRTSRTQRWALLAALGILVSCGGGGAGGSGQVDHSGTWHVAVGPDPKFTMDLDQTGSTCTFQIHGADVPIAGTGTVTGQDLSLAANIAGWGTFTADLVFDASDTAFEGVWEIPAAPLSGTMTGSLQPWATYDLDALGAPRFATADAADLEKIARVSRFRSGTGHDYSDDFETCRSMKHYVHPLAGVDMSTIRIFAPCAGTVIGMTEEWDGPSLWKGTAVGIRPDGFPASHIVLFHVDLDTPLAVGDHVHAGQVIGTSEKTSGTASDIAVGVHTPTGFRLVSYFEVITDAVFQGYAARGVLSRAQMIITRAQRDAAPLACDGEEFVAPDTPGDWVNLL